MARSLRALHDQRGLTPATVTGPAGAEPALSRRPPAELRADPAGDRSVLFRLLAPAAQEVLLGGTFNDFDASRHPMTRTPEGVWEAALVLPVGRYGYKFKVDGNWRLDPTNPEQTPAPRESSLIDVQ
jgi:1,4-alpha-glucan branching enzyme